MDTNTNNRKIVSISFLYAGERVRIGANRNGKFPLPKITLNKTRMHPYTAREFVEHMKVRIADPFLTLSDGSKLRVYQGGDPTAMVVESDSVIENHDNAEKDALRARKKNTIKKPTSTKKNKGTFSFLKEALDDYDDFYFGFDYPDSGDKD